MAKEYQVFKNSIENFMKEQNLDIGAKYFVLKDILHDVEAQYFEKINSEIMEEAKGKAKRKDGGADGN